MSNTMTNLDAPSRLSKLTRGVLTRTTNPVLEDVVRRAAGVAQTPMAHVSLVLENFQVIRAAVGIPPELNTSRVVDRCDSFCQYVVANEGAFIVPDVAIDERIPRELAESLGIRAYAGVPVFIDGEAVGTMCVLDTVPRTFNDSTAARLKSIADIASNELERESRRSDDGSLQAHLEFEGECAEHALPTCHPELRPIITDYLESLPRTSRPFALARLMLKTRFAHTLNATNVPALRASMLAEIARLRVGS